MRTPARTGTAVVLVAAIASLPVAYDQPRAASEEIALPHTIRQVWYRPGKARTFGGAKSTGDLTLTLEALEYDSGKEKNNFYLPMESVVSVSFGLVPGDVNTEWVLLRVDEGRGSRLLGFRDGRKLGFGTRTRDIYERIRNALKQAGAGQYDVPAGFTTYDELDYMFTIGYPAEWSVYHHSASEVHETLLLGEVIYSEEPVTVTAVSGANQGTGNTGENLARIRRGETAAFSVLREGPQDGIRCSRISEKAEKGLIERARLEGTAATTDVATDTVLIDGCRGLRLRWRVTPQDGRPYVVDRRVVADERATYTFTLRSPIDAADERTLLFNQAMSTFRFTDAALP